MAYPVVEVDVTGPLPDLDPGRDDADGLAVVLRDGRLPLGLLLLAGRGRGLPAGELAALAVRAGAERLVAERVRRELLGGAPAPQPPAPDGPEVTVAVCTRDRPEDLEQCLAHLQEAVAAWGGGAEVIVVDNAPPDDRTEQAVRRHPAVRYVREPVAGLDLARDRALAEARGRWLAFVDDDVRVDRDWLGGLAAARAEHPDAVAVTGLVLPAELETDAQVRFERGGGFGRGVVQRRWDGRHGPGGHLHPIGAGVFGAGCDMAFDVAVLRRLGGFDEALDTGPPLPGGGDLDVFFRVLDAGLPLVYEPRMAVYHRHRRGTDELRRQYGSWGSGFAAYLGARWADPRLRGDVLRISAWWLRYQARRLAGAAVRGDREGARMVLAELAGGVTGVGGHRRSQRRVARRRAAVHGR